MNDQLEVTLRTKSRYSRVKKIVEGWGGEFQIYNLGGESTPSDDEDILMGGCCKITRRALRRAVCLFCMLTNMHGSLSLRKYMDNLSFQQQFFPLFSYPLAICAPNSMPQKNAPSFTFNWSLVYAHTDCLLLLHHTCTFSQPPKALVLNC